MQYYSEIPTAALDNSKGHRMQLRYKKNCNFRPILRFTLEMIHETA